MQIHREFLRAADDFQRPFQADQSRPRDPDRCIAAAFNAEAENALTLQIKGPAELERGRSLNRHYRRFVSLVEQM